MSVIITATNQRRLTPGPVIEWIDQRLEPGMFHPSNCPRFAETFGITARSYHRWRKGGNVMPVALERLADAYGVHPSEIHPDYWDAVI